MPRSVRYPEIGNHVKIQKKYVPTDLQNAHFAAAAATDWLTCEVLRVDIERHSEHRRLDRRVVTLRHPPHPAESICEFVSFGAKCEILDVAPVPPAPAPVNARDILLQVADAFNAVLGHVNDEEVPVEDSDSGEEVDVEEVPEDVAAPREGWVEELCTIDGRGAGAAHPHAATSLRAFEGSEPFDYFMHFLPGDFIRNHLIPCINAALPAGSHVDFTEFLAWLGVLIRFCLFAVPEEVFWELPLGIETAAVMTRQRFHAIWKALQAQLVSQILAGHPADDPHRYVAPLFQAFNERMFEAVLAGQSLCLDESMLGWFGKRWLLDGWVTHEAKPIKFGYETKVMACPRTHFFLHMELCTSRRNAYVSSKEFFTVERGRRVAQIMRMCKPWFATGRTITMDSGFGSPLAAALLMQHGLFSVMMTKKTAHWPQYVPSNLLSYLPDESDAIAGIKKRIPVERGVSHIVHITLHRSAKPRVYIHTAHVATRVPSPFPMYHLVGSGAARHLELKQVQPPEVGMHYSRTRSAVDAGNKERVSPSLPLSEVLHCNHPVPKVFLFILGVVETNAKLAWTQGQHPAKPHWHYFREKLAKSLLFMHTQARVRRGQGVANAEHVVSHAIKRFSSFTQAETAAVWGHNPPDRKRLRCSECHHVATTCCVCSTNAGLCIKCFPKHVITRDTKLMD